VSAEGVRVSPQWLALREPADAAARAVDLAEQLAEHLADRLTGRPPAPGPAVIHDLGAGTGAMGRWLAPRLPGPQHWVLHDRDGELLAVATAQAPGAAADGSAVTVEARRSDIAGLPAGALSGATVVTASALLDMLTEEDLGELVSACATPECPVLLTLSVIGRVGLDPAEPLDARLAAAFNAHQRRITEHGRLLGPDAVRRALAQFEALGAEVYGSLSPWQLNAGQPELVREWLTGWVAAACQQEPRLAAEAEAYSKRRLAQLRTGKLAVSVGHADLLVLPGQQASWNRDDSA
jgi:hypothetical protein